MTYRPRFPLLFLGSILLAHPAWGDEPPSLALSAVATPSGLEEGPPVGLPLLSLPLESRSSITDYVGRNAPGASLSGGRLLFRGGRSEDTAVELDGLRLRGPFLPMALVERLDVASAGHGAAWSDVLGGLVGATTRSGSNRFHADVDLSAELREPAGAELAPSVSGPIVRDRLYYVAAISGQATRARPEQDPEGIINDSPGLERTAQITALKLTFLPRPAHRVEALGVVNAARSKYGAPLGTEEEAQPSYEELDLLTSLGWTGHWEKLAARSQVAFQSLRLEERPSVCDSKPECESVPATVQKFPRRIQSGSWGRQSVTRETEWQLVNGLEARVFERPWIRARLRATSRVSLRSLSARQHRTGDSFFEYNGGPEALTQFFANDPRLGPPQFGWFDWSGSLLASNHALEAETRLFGNLWVVPGLALAAGRTRTDYITLGASALTPHLGLAWDPSGDGRTWVRASTHERASADLESLVRFNRGIPWSQKCSWNPDTMAYDRACVVSGGNFNGSVGFPCGADGVDANGIACGQSFRLPRAWEHAFSVEHDVGLGVRPFLEVVYRRPRNLPVVTETNRVWSPGMTTVLGYGNGRQEEVRDYSTGGSGSRYTDYTLGVRKDAGAFRLFAAYTYSPYRLSPVVQDSRSGTNLLVALEPERPHAFRTLLSYELSSIASVGLLYRYDSGAPYPSFFRNPAPSSYEDYRGATGTSAGTNISDPADDRPLRAPDLSSLNLQLRVRTGQLLGPDFHLYADLMNVFGALANPREDASYATFVRSKERWLRLGLEYRH